MALPIFTILFSTTLRAHSSSFPPVTLAFFLATDHVKFMCSSRKHPFVPATLLFLQYLEGCIPVSHATVALIPLQEIFSDHPDLIWSPSLPSERLFEVIGSIYVDSGVVYIFPQLNLHPVERGTLSFLMIILFTVNRRAMHTELSKTLRNDWDYWLDLELSRDQDEKHKFGK